MTWFQQLLALILAPTLVVAAMTWILRALFSQALSRDIEKLKSELKTEAFREQYRFQKLHERQAEVISDLYARMVHAERKMGQLTSRFRPVYPSLEGQKGEAAKACDSFADFFREHRLYLPEETAEKVQKLVDLLAEIFIDIDCAQPGDEYQPSNADDWREANERMENQARPAKKELEKQFRGLLGVE
ncbi:hypothetical protein HOP52_17870 [Halomonas campisalis]|uniref:Uncharacterized protein n=1 Tax=Billgrantia campisalis TaxID=74661 RepID=A0ABS9PD80_9GAMM|nr:hypothetical protein [Halomonas campisalis]MCG6659621.1 hypothetical protein [Halomonas campisalis]MDR5864582.1 hypothetical protein [Halomonas campisalis]